MQRFEELDAAPAAVWPPLFYSKKCSYEFNRLLSYQITLQMFLFSAPLHIVT